MYSVKLTNKKDKESLFDRLGIAISDVILSCERKSNSNLDMNLANIVLNINIKNIIEGNNLRKIFFSSRFVEKLFKKHFRDLITGHPEIEFITLPSPSPRYAAMSKSEKISKYKQLLPKLLENYYVPD